MVGSRVSHRDAACNFNGDIEAHQETRLVVLSHSHVYLLNYDFQELVNVTCKVTRGLRVQGFKEEQHKFCAGRLEGVVLEVLNEVVKEEPIVGCQEV